MSEFNFPWADRSSVSTLRSNYLPSYGSKQMLPNVLQDASTAMNPVPIAPISTPFQTPITDALSSYGGGSSTMSMDAAKAISEATNKYGTSPGILSSIGDWFKSSGFLGSTDAKGNRTDGWGGLALGTAQGLMNYGLYKDQNETAKQNIALQRDAYETNKKMNLAQIQDRIINREERRRASGMSTKTNEQALKDYGL